MGVRRLYYAMVYGYQLTVVLCLVLSCLTTADAHLSPDAISCGIFQDFHPTGTPTRLDSELLSNGMFGELYDVNQDGVPDVAVYTPTFGGLVEVEPNRFEPLHSEIPTFYELDTIGHDQRPDVLYIDVYGTRECHDLKLYAYLTTRRTHPLGFVIRWDGINEFRRHLPRN